MLENFDDLISTQNECEWFERKVNNVNLDLIAQNISAIANSCAILGRDCGYVVWGIDDNGKIVGTNFQPENARNGNQSLEMWLSQIISPVPNFEFKEINFDDHRLVLLEIPAASRIPVRFKEVQYIRVGSNTTTLKNNPDKEELLLSKLSSSSNTWEDEICMSDLAADRVISLLNTQEFFAKIDLPMPNNSDAVIDRLANYKIIIKQPNSLLGITNFGAISFAKSVNDFQNIEHKYVRVVQYTEGAKTGAIRQRDFTAGYALDFKDIFDYIQSMLPIDETIEGAVRETNFAFPSISIREFLANLLIHQDFSIRGAAPIVELYPDRIVFTNPGASLSDPARAIDQAAISRNVRFANFMRNIGLCESLGTGLDKAAFAAEKANLPAPEFDINGTSTVAIVHGPRKYSQFTKREKIHACYVHACLRHGISEKATNSSLRDRFGVSSSYNAEMSRVLKFTREEDLIKLADSSEPRSGYVPFWA